MNSIILGDGVNILGDKSFSGCSNLENIQVEEGNPDFDSHNNCNAIIEKATKTLILGCKNSIIPENVVNIGNNAFFSCYGLISLSFPNSVRRIGESAFENCHELKIIRLPQNLMYIGNYSFYDCANLKVVYCNANETPEIESTSFRREKMECYVSGS